MVALLGRIVTILEAARARVVRTVNSEMVLAYWHIGREIVEQMQKGSARADYGDQLLEALAERLGQRFGRGFSTTNLKYFRIFYQVYSDREPRIRHKACDELEGKPRKVTRLVPFLQPSLLPSRAEAHSKGSPNASVGRITER